MLELNVMSLVNIFKVFYLYDFPSFSASFSSMSAVIFAMSYSGFHPHSARAVLSSSEFGHESAISCLTGSTA